MMAEEQPSDLACRLLAPGGLELRNEYLAMFEQALSAAARRMHEPSTPDEFATAKALADCSALVGEILIDVWQRLHRN